MNENGDGTEKIKMHIMTEVPAHDSMNVSGPKDMKIVKKMFFIKVCLCSHEKCHVVWKYMWL